MELRTQRPPYRMFFFSVLAPTSAQPAEDKEAFYRLLSEHTADIISKYPSYILGDFNASLLRVPPQYESVAPQQRYLQPPAPPRGLHGAV